MKNKKKGKVIIMNKKDKQNKLINWTLEQCLEIKCKYDSGKMSCDIDETGAGGFWDISKDMAAKKLSYDDMAAFDALAEQYYDFLQTLFIVDR